VDYGGDFLLEIFHSPYSTAIEDNTWRLNSDYGRLPDMLLHDSEDVSEFKGYAPDRLFNRDSISHLLRLTQDVKKYPVRLTHLLVQMAKADLEYVLGFQNPVCAVDLRNTVEVVKKYCLGNDGTSHIRYSHDLAIILTRWRDRLAGGWDSDHVPEYLIKELVGPDELTMRCTQVIHGLLAPRVMMFGLRANRSIACARPVVPVDAATGWMSMYL
jgi:hypothetical protein